MTPLWDRGGETRGREGGERGIDETRERETR